MKVYLTADEFMGDGLFRRSRRKLNFWPKGNKSSKDVRDVRAYCAVCPVAELCRNYALQKEYVTPESGIWGGTLPADRRKLLKQTAQEGAIR